MWMVDERGGMRKAELKLSAIADSGTSASLVAEAHVTPEAMGTLRSEEVR